MSQKPLAFVFLLLVINSVIAGDVVHLPEKFTYNKSSLEVEYQSIQSGISIVNFEGNFDKEINGVFNTAPRQAVIQALVDENIDHSDFVVFFTQFPVDSGEAAAFYSGIKNDVSGIGLPLFNHQAAFGSSQLQGMIDMTEISDWNWDTSAPEYDVLLDVMIHEVMHRWGPAITYDEQGQSEELLLGSDNIHWNYFLNSHASVMYGSLWTDMGDGTFKSAQSLHSLSPLDLYLMGMKPASSVPDFFVIENGVPGDKSDTPPLDGSVVSGVKKQIAINDVIASEGVRSPAFDESQHRFKMHFVILKRSSQEVSEQDIGRLLTLQKQFQSRFHADTQGIGSMEFPSDVVSSGAIETLSYNPANLNNYSQTLAIEFLTSKKELNFWQDKAATAIRDTVVVLQSLQVLNEGSLLDGVKGWLSSQEELNNDQAAWLLLSGALDSSKSGSLHYELVEERQNEDGGWGLETGDASNPYDTAMVLWSLKSTFGSEFIVKEESLAYLRQQLNSDFGSGFSDSGRSSIAATAKMIQAMTAIGGFEAELTQLADYLASRQSENGSIGSLQETLVATEALLHSNEPSHLAAVDLSLNFINQSQSIDHSFEGSVYSTALAAKLLSGEQRPNFKPINIELNPQAVAGEQVLIKATFLNNGHNRIDSTTVGLIHDDELVASDIFEQWPAGQELIADLLFDTAGLSGTHSIAVMADVDELVDERNEQDNEVEVSIEISPPSSMPELFFRRGESQYQPSQFDTLPFELTADAVIENLSTQPINNLSVGLYRQGDSEELTLISEQIHAIGAGQAIPISFTHQVTSAEGDLDFLLIIDHQHVIEEFNEDNNKWQMPITHLPTVDLVITMDDINLLHPVVIGEQNLIDFNFKNSGTLPVPSFWVNVTADGGSGHTDLYQVEVPEMSGGQTLNRSFVWVPEITGNHELEFSIDDLYSIAEANESNNVASLAIDVVENPLTNIRIDDATLMPSPGLTAEDNQLQVIITNDSSTSAGTFTVHLSEQFDDGSQVLLSSTTATDGVVAQSSVQHVIDIPQAIHVGDTTFLIHIDADQQLNEFNENDNLLIKDFRFLSIPDAMATPAALSFNPSQPVAGSILELTFSATNLGEQPLHDLTVDWYAISGADTAEWIGQTTITEISGGSSESTMLNHMMPADNQITAFQVILDQEAEISESNENNNQASLNVEQQDQSFYLTDDIFSPNGDGIQDETQFIFNVQNTDAYSIKIYDVHDRLVRTFEPVHWQNTDKGDVIWDGRDSDGKILTDGSYRVTLTGALSAVNKHLTAIIDTNRTPMLETLINNNGIHYDLSCLTNSPRLYGSFSNDGKYFLTRHYLDKENDPQDGLFKFKTDASRVESILPRTINEPELTNVYTSPITDGSVFVRSYEGLDLLYKIDPESGMYSILNTTGLDEFNVKFLSDEFALVKSNSDYYKIFHDGFTPPDRLEFTEGLQNIYGIYRQGNFLEYKADIDSNENLFISPFNNPAISLNVSEDMQVDSSVIYNHNISTDKMLAYHGDRLSFYHSNAHTITKIRSIIESSDILEVTFLQDNKILIVLEGELKMYSGEGELLGKVTHPFTLETLKQNVIAQYGSLNDLPIWSEECDTTHISFNDIQNAGFSVKNYVVRRATDEKIYVDTDFKFSFRGIVDDPECEYSPVYGHGSVELTDDFFPLKIIYDDSGIISATSTEGLLIEPLFYEELSNFWVNWSNWNVWGGWAHGLLKHSDLLSERYDISFADDYELLKTHYKQGFADKLMVKTESSPEEHVCTQVGFETSSFFQSKDNLTALIKTVPSVSGIEIIGSAFDANFSHYELRAKLKDSANESWHTIHSSGAPVNNKSMFTWLPERSGVYMIEIIAYDLAGHSKTDRSEIYYGKTNRAINNVHIHPKYFSPNGDGRKDELFIEYDVIQATEAIITVIDESRNVVYRSVVEHSSPQSGIQLSWNGLDQTGSELPSGAYEVQVNDYSFFISLDKLLPPFIEAERFYNPPSKDTPAGKIHFPLSDYSYNWVIQPPFKSDIPNYLLNQNIKTGFLGGAKEKWDTDSQSWQITPDPLEHGYDQFDNDVDGIVFRNKLYDEAGNILYTPNYEYRPVNKLIPFAFGFLSENGDHNNYDFFLITKNLLAGDYEEKIHNYYDFRGLINQPTLFLQTFSKESISQVNVRIFADEILVDEKFPRILSREESEKYFEESELIEGLDLPPKMFPIIQLGKRYYGFGLPLDESDFEHSFSDSLIFKIQTTMQNGEVIDSEFILKIPTHEDILPLQKLFLHSQKKLSEAVGLTFLQKYPSLANEVDSQWQSMTSNISVKNDKRYVLKYYFGLDSEKLVTNQQLNVIRSQNIDFNQLNIQPMDHATGKVGSDYFHLGLFEIDDIGCKGDESFDWKAISKTGEVDVFSNSYPHNNFCISGVTTNQTFNVGGMCDASYPGNDHTILNLKFFADSFSEELALVELFGSLSQDDPPLLWSETNLDVKGGEILLDLPINSSTLHEGKNLLHLKFKSVEGDEKSFIINFIVNKSPSIRSFLGVEGRKFCGTKDINDIASVRFKGLQSIGNSDFDLPVVRVFVNDLMKQVTFREPPFFTPNHLAEDKIIEEGEEKYKESSPGIQDFPDSNLINLGSHNGPATLTLESVNLFGRSTCDIAQIEIDTQVDVNMVSTGLSYISPNGDDLNDESILAVIDAWESLDVSVAIVKNILYSQVLSTFEMFTGETRELFWDGVANNQQLPDGPYTLRVLAQDDCMIKDQIESMFVIDTVAPDFVFEAPSDQDQVPGIFEVQVRIDEPNLDQKSVALGYMHNGQFHHSEIELEEIPENEPGDYRLTSVVNLSGLPLDTYELVVEAVDLAGNENDHSIFVHRVEPHEIIWNFNLSPSYISPDGDDLFETLNIDLGLNKSAHVTVDVLTESEQLVAHVVNDVSMEGGSHSLSWDGLDEFSQAVSDGRYVIQVSAYDPDIPAAVEVLQLTFVVDTTLPVVAYQPADVVIPGEGIFKALVTEKNVLSTQFWLQPQSPLSAEYEVFAGSVSGELDLFDLITLDEGLYQLRAEISDRAGHKIESTHSFTVDNTAPMVSWLEPENEAMIGGDSTKLSVTIDEVNFESASIDWSLDSDPPVWQNITPIAEVVDNTFDHDWNVDVDDGIYLMRALALDQAGHETEMIQKITIDRTPPVAEISSPVNFSTYGSPIHITGTVTDANLSEYQLSYRIAGEGDGDWRLITVGVDEKNNESLFEWSHDLPSGDYQIRLLATDLAKHKTEVVIDVSTDTSPPPTPNPFNAEVQTENDVVLSWGAVNAPDLAGYFVYRGGVRLNSEVITTTSLEDPDLADGRYTYWVVAVDLLGNVSEPSEAEQVLIDTTAPHILLLAPMNETTVSGDVVVKGSASSNTDDFKRADLYLRGLSEAAPGHLLYSTTLAVTSESLTSIDTTTLISGDDYIIRWQAEDINGNLAAVEHQVKVDNDPPAAPINLSYQLQGISDIELSWSANSEGDLAGYVVFRNDAIISGQNLINGTITETQYVDVDVPDGEHIYYVVAIDSAGNISSASNTVTVDIDRRAPDAWFVEPADGKEFEAVIRLLADTEDSDIAGMLFEYHTGDGIWVALEDDLEAPYDAVLDPEALSLSYGDITIRVTARDQGGQSDATPDERVITYTDLTAPSAVENLNHTVDGGDVVLTWEISVAPDVENYQLFRKELSSNGGSDFTLISDVPHPELTYTHNGLPDGQYQYRIHAVDGHDNSSNATESEPVTVWSVELDQPFTPLLGEVEVRFDGNTPQSGEMELSWLNSNGTDTSHVFHLQQPGSFTTPDLPLSIGDNSLSVSQVDAEGNRSKTVNRTVQLSPEPPTPINKVVQMNDFELLLNWQAPEVDSVGYLPYLNGRPVFEIEQVSAGLSVTASSYNSRAGMTVDGDSSSYWSPYYHDAIGEEPLWIEAQFDAPIWVSGFTIEWYPDYYSDGRAALPSEYQVQFLSAQGWVTAVDLSGSNNATVSHENPVPYLTERVRILMPFSDGYEEVRLSEWVIKKQPYLTSTSFSTVLNDGIYQVQLSAINSYGFESELTPAQELTVGDVEPPAAVTLTGDVFDTYHVSLSWTASGSADVSNYRLFRNGEFFFVTQDGSQLSHDDLNLTNGDYVYQVAAVDAAGNQSELSNEVALTINRELITAPENLVVTADDQSATLNLLWDEVSSPYLAYYQIYRSTSANSGFEPLAQSNDNQWQDVVDTGIRYYYYVSAVDDLGNESSPSNIANGIVFSLLRPGVPVILSPVTGGGTLDVTEIETTITGTAKDSDSVDLYHDNVWVAQTDTSNDYSVIASEYDDYLNEVKISHHDWLAHYDYGSESVGLYNELSGESLFVNLNVQYDGFWWSGNGEHLFVVAEDAGNETLYKVEMDGSFQSLGLSSDRIDVVSVSDDETQLIYTGNGINPDTSVNEFGFWHLNLQTQELKRIVLPENVEITQKAVQWISNEEVVFINYPVHIFFNGVLWRYNLVNENLEQLDGETAHDAQLISSKDKNHIYYENIQDGKKFITRVQLSDLTELSYIDEYENVSKPSVGSDPDLIFAAVGYGDHVLLNMVTGEIIQLFQNLGSEMQSVWIQNEVIKATPGYVQFLIVPPGYFEFNQVALNAGINEYHAIGLLDSGFESEPSEPIYLNLITAVLPDLAVESTDIYISPDSLLSGDVATGVLILRNEGQVAVDNVTTHINLIRPDLIVTPILSSPLVVNLDAGEALSMRFNLNQLDQEGEYKIQVHMDPDQEVIEINEQNNVASKGFWVLNNELPHLTVQLSDDRLYADEQLLVELQVYNPSIPFTGDVVATLTDDQGYPTALTSTFHINELANLGQWSESLDWSVDQLFAGDYLLDVELFNDSGEVISQVISELTILDQSLVELTSAISPPPHQIGQSVEFSAQLTYSEGNTLIDGLLMWSVVNDADQIVWQTQQNVNSMAPGDAINLVQSWQPTQGGQFTLWVELSGHTALIPLPFTVNEANEEVRLRGEISLNPARLSLSDNQIIHYQIQNTGTVDFTAIPVRLSVLNKTMSQTLIQDDRLLDLNVSAQSEEQVSFDTRSLSVDEYVIVLRADLSAYGLDWVTLDHMNFSTIDEQAPDLLVISPFDQGVYPANIIARAEATDQWSDMAEVTVQIDNLQTLLMQSHVGTSVYEIPLSNLSEGLHQLDWQANDVAGNQVNVSTAFTVDTTPPEIDIQGVEEQGLYASSVSAVVVVSDLHLENSQVTLNGIDYISGTTISNEGGHLLMVTAVDAAGNRSNAQRQFTIDTTAPEVMITHPINNSETMQGSTNVIGQSEAGATIYLSLNGQNWQVVADHTGAFVFENIPLEQGANVMTLFAQDEVLNTGDSIQLTITFTPPVTLSGHLEAPASVANGDMVDVVYTVSNTSQQDVIQQPIQLRLNELNDALLLSKDQIADISAGSDYQENWQFDTSTLTTGNKRLSLWVEQSGQWQLLAEQLIELVDETPPMIVVDQPLEQNTYGSELTLRIRVTDEHSEVGNVEYQMADGQWMFMNFDGTYYVTDLTLAHGLHQVQFRAADTEGNVGISALIDFDVDAQAPEIIISYPSNGLISNQAVTISYEITDANDFTEETTLNGQIISSGHSVDTEGVHELLVSASDVFANERSISHLFTIDQTPPVITIISPDDGAQVSIPVFDLVGDMSEAGQVTVMLNGQSYVIKSNSEGLFDFSNLPLEPGMNTLEISAVDVAGNVSDVVIWTVEYMAYGAVSGSIWHDLNGNGLIDGGEPAMVNIDVALLGQTGPEYAAATDGTGEFSMPQVVPGEYQLILSDPAISSQWFVTTQNHPANITVMTDGDYVIDWGLNRNQPLITSHIKATERRGRLLVLMDSITDVSIPPSCQGVASWRAQTWVGEDVDPQAILQVKLYSEQNQLIQTEQVQWSEWTGDSGQIIDNEVANQSINLVIHPPSAGRISVAVMTDQANHLSQKLRIEAEINGVSLVSDLIGSDCALWADWGDHLGDWQLVEVSLYPEQSSDDPNSSSFSPMVREQQMLLKQLLDDGGWSYQLTDDMSTFTDGVVSGEFVAYMVLAENLTLTPAAMNQLGDAVALGDGLFLSSQDANLAIELQEITGAMVAGNQDASTVQVTDAAVMGQGTAALADTEQVLEMQTSTGSEVAIFSDLGTPNNDAVISHQNGLGRTVLFGFDVLLQATSHWGREGFYQWIIDGINHVIRPDHGVGIGKARRVELTLINQSQAVSGHVQVNLPQGVTLAYSPLNVTTNAEGFSFDYQLMDYDSDVFEMWLVVDESPATVTFDVHVIGYQLPVINDEITLTAGVVPDLNAFVTNCQVGAKPEQGIKYQFRIENRGNTAINGAQADFTLNQNLGAATWQCSGTGGGSCDVSQGSGNISQQIVNLPIFSTVVFDIETAVISDVGASIEATALITMPQGIDDMNGIDNRASDRDAVYHFVFKNGFECAAPTTGSVK